MYGFIVTSALNTRFGVYTTEQRLEQTIDTIASIEERCPNATIILVEMAGIPLTDEQRDILQPLVTDIFDFTHEKPVIDIYNSTDNWDIVKNLTEITCFGYSLGMIASYDAYKDVDRWFKVSGRYLLNSDFKIEQYSKPEYDGKIVFVNKRVSQFDPKITKGAKYQFMSRCWSFPAKDIRSIQFMFNSMQASMLGILSKGGYLDIEHLLYQYTDPGKVLEVNTVGVQGLLGPNGILVKD
jgi:hypothetical protein